MNYDTCVILPFNLLFVPEIFFPYIVILFVSESSIYICYCFI